MAAVLVGGGAGGVGEGIVRALVSAGHTVVVPSRLPERLDLLRRRLDLEQMSGSLITMVGHIGEGEGAAEMRDRISSAVGRLDVLIPSLGGWWDAGHLLEMTIGEWDAVMAEMLRTHFVFARTFIPQLQRDGGGRYIAIGGGAAYVPIVGSGPVCMAAAAQLMMTRVLYAESQDSRIQILELVIDGPVRTRDTEAIAQRDWITADDVGATVLELVASGKTERRATTTSGPIVRMRPDVGG